MRDIPPKVSEGQLPWVQVTPYHRHNSVNISRHLLHSTQHLLLGGDCLGHLYIHYIAIVTTVTVPCLIPFEQRNVIDNELPHRTINSCYRYQKMNNFTICNFHFCLTVSLPVSNDELYQMSFLHPESTCIHYTCVS